MGNSTFSGVVRSGPKGDAYAGSVALVAEISFDPTAASASTGVTLPSGAIITDVVPDGGATGGASPTIDIGTSGTSDAYVAEGDADGRTSALAAGTLGAGAGVALTADTLVYAGVGASAATGGTVTAKIMYYRQDSTTGVNR